MRRRKFFFEVLVPLLLSTSVTTWATATEREGQASMDGALRSWNEGRSEEAMAELQSVIEELEGESDVEQARTRLKDAYLVLGLVQLSVHDKASARESFGRAEVDPAHASHWVEALTPDLLRWYAKWRAEGQTPVTESVRRERHLASKKEASTRTPELAFGSRVLGALVGALIRTDRWIDIPSDSIRVRVGGGYGSMGVQVVLSF